MEKFICPTLQRSERVIKSLSLVTNEEFYIDRNGANSHLLKTDTALLTSNGPMLYSLPDLVIWPTHFFSLNAKEKKKEQNGLLQ